MVKHTEITISGKVVLHKRPKLHNVLHWAAQNGSHMNSPYASIVIQDLIDLFPCKNIPCPEYVWSVSTG